MITLNPFAIILLALVMGMAWLLVKMFRSSHTVTASHGHPTRRAEITSVQTDPIEPCRGQHDLRPILFIPQGEAIRDVVNWCAHCGAVVIDSEIDGRINPGNVLPMQFPARETGDNLPDPGLLSIITLPRAEEEYTVVRWCEQHGTIQVDTDIDGRIYQGDVLALQYPRRAQRINAPET